jgi:hypothetical protein
VKCPTNYPRKRYAVRELQTGENATDALKWVERELMDIDRLISEALNTPKT